MIRRCALIFFVHVIASSAHAEVDASSALNSAIRAYNGGNYKQVITLLKSQLYPQIRFAREQDVLRAHKLIGISYLFTKDLTSARKEFRAILAQRPDYRLDPLSDPVAAVELFDQLKEENAQQVREVLDQDRKDRAREAERKRAEAKRREEMERLSRRVVEKTVTKKSYWLNFIPFGVGQFQNEQTTKGYIFLGTEAALAGISIGSALWLRLSYPDNTVPGSEYDTADAIRLMQVVSGGLFIATAIYGVIDALWHFEEESIETREYEIPLQSFHVVPSLMASGGGVGVGGTF